MEFFLSGVVVVPDKVSSQIELFNQEMFKHLTVWKLTDDKLNC